MYTFISGKLAKIIINILDYLIVPRQSKKQKQKTGNQENNLPILLGISK